MQLSFKDRYFYQNLIRLSLPIMLQNLITSCLNFVDTFMLGQLGEATIAAVGFANQIFFLYNLTIIGLVGGMTVFLSQYWGKRDMENINRIMGICTALGAAFGLLVLIIVQIIPGQIIGLFSQSEEVRELGTVYLRIVSLTYVMYALSFGFAACIKCTGKPVIPMRISAICVGINILVNYLLIFGKLGFPQMGIAGAAIGTLIARAVELLLIGRHAFFGHLKLRLRKMFDLSVSFIRYVLKTSMPVLLNDATWAIAVVVGTWSYSTLGTETFAAYQISNTILEICTMVLFGISTASGIMIGNKIGCGLVTVAMDYSKRFMKISAILGALAGGLLFVLSPLILSLFHVQPQTVETALYGLRAMSVIVMFKAFDTTTVVGILRGGGDTHYAFVLETCTMGLISVPMALIGAVWLKLPLWTVILMVGLEDFAKALISAPRVLSGKWIKRLV